MKHPAVSWQLGGFVATAVVLSVLAIGVSCSAFDDLPVPQTCHGIPEGGCPGSGKANCEDLTCAAIYTCESDGGWSLSVACPARDGGVRDASESMARDVDIDVPPGAYGAGCMDLEGNDCNLGLALSCPANQCCGCANIFVCNDGGWDPWGSCLESGAFVHGDASLSPEE